MLKKIGDRISFGKRSGMVIGHATFKRWNYIETVETYYIVELDPTSSGYLEAIGDEQEKDTFISMMLVHVGNEDSDAGK